MAKIAPGLPAPEFTLVSQDGSSRSLLQFRGKKVILYFYPQDDTETCTLQACMFRDHSQELSAANAQVIGISPDSVGSHERFVSKFDLNFTLLSDEHKEVLKLYGVWKRKTMFGRTYMGVIRTTVLIDEQGIITHCYSNVRLKGHMQKILEAIR